MANLGRRKEDLIPEDSTSLQGVLTPDLTLKSVNGAWEKLLGYSREALLAKSLLRFVDQNEHAAALTLVNLRLAAAENRPVEFSLRCRDGSYKCFAWERRPARGGEGTYVTGRDITERKKMETTANLQKYLQSKRP
jgi:PAS domain S-box-containing protein